jgi:hypothetical protein
MYNDLGMRYKKVKEVALHENAVRNVILRQEWASMLIDLATKKTRLINIDETWLGQEDFSRMKWKLPGVSNSVAKKDWAPSISLLLAFDNFGESYVALSQANTNTYTFIMFIRDLVRQLTVENRRWRTNTLIFIDGAPAHQSKDMMQVWEELDVPVAISAAHSYDMAPCELWFALFKSTNINPHRLRTGKG